MTVISERDFGKLEATVQAQTATLLRVEQRIGQVMTKDEVNEILKELAKVQRAHDERIENLEQINAVRAASIWSRIGTSADNTFVSFVGKVVFLAFGALIATYFLSNYSLEPKSDALHNNVRGE